MPPEAEAHPRPAQRCRAISDPGDFLAVIIKHTVADHDCGPWYDNIVEGFETLGESGREVRRKRPPLDPAEVERLYPPVALDIVAGDDWEFVDLFREYIEAERAHAQLLGLEEEETAEEEAADQRVTDAVEALGRAPARSLTGAALKIFAMLLYSDEAEGAKLYPVWSPPKWPDEEPCGMDALNVGFVRDLRRLIPGLSPLIAPEPSAVA